MPSPFQLATQRELGEAFSHPERLSWEEIHAFIKQIFDSLVPASFRVRSRSETLMRPLIPTEVMNSAQLAPIMAKLVEALSKRPERSTLCDIELNAMMSAYRRWQNPTVLEDKPEVKSLPEYSGKPYFKNHLSDL